jgi:hypothetical protein
VPFGEERHRSVERLVSPNVQMRPLRNV